MGERAGWTRREVVIRGALGAGALAVPLLASGRSYGQANPDAPVKHLILMYAGGGLRCSAAFNAGTSRQLNPYGVYPEGRGWRVGRIFSDQRVKVPSLGTSIPSLVELADTYSVVGNVDHTPGAPRGDGGHGTGYLRMGTGDPTANASGLHTLINAELRVPRGAPTYVIGRTAKVFGLGRGELRVHRPVFVGEPQGVSYLLRRLRGLGGLTNQNLSEIFPDDGAWGRQAALAVRLLQKGSPAVALGVGGYDTHVGEAGGFDVLMDSYGRALQGLHFALSLLRHPLGGSFWDHTMVIGVSEFGRDNTSEKTGFNVARGSDHQGTSPSRYQTFPVGGGAIAPGVVVGDVDGETWEPIDREIVSSRQVLATLLWALGIEPAKYGFGNDTPIFRLFT